MTTNTTITAKTSNLTIQLLRSLVVGGVAFVVDFSALYALTEFGLLHYLVSSSLAFLAGVSVNYSLSIVWVFNQRTLDNRIQEFTIFALIGVVGLLLNLSMMWFFTEMLRLHYLNSKIAATILIFLFNFAVRRAFLFSVKKTALSASVIFSRNPDNYR